MEEVNFWQDKAKGGEEEWHLKRNQNMKNLTITHTTSGYSNCYYCNWIIFRVACHHRMITHFKITEALLLGIFKKSNEMDDNIGRNITMRMSS